MMIDGEELRCIIFSETLEKKPRAPEIAPWLPACTLGMYLMVKEQ